MAENSKCNIVIIGGGVMGCALAYHLTQRGERDVVLLEQSALTHGSTWHAPALFGQLRGTSGYTQIMRQSGSIYRSLLDEEGAGSGFNQVGSIRIASTEARWKQILRLNANGNAFGLDAKLLSSSEIKALCPFIEADGIFGGLLVDTDGSIDPNVLTQAFARRARANGAIIVEGERVVDFRLSGRRVTGVITDKREITPITVVNCAGMWGHNLAKKMSARLPTSAVEHQYVVLEPTEVVDRNYPVIRDPDGGFYLEPRKSGTMVGAPLPNSKLFVPPQDFAMTLLPEDGDKLERLMLPAMKRFPFLEALGIRSIIHGPIPSSPDDEPVIGPQPELDNVFVAGGFTNGIACAGGATKVLADWIVDGDPGIDVSELDIARFAPHESSDIYLEERSVEAHGQYYIEHPMGNAPKSQRNLRRSPFHTLLESKGAVFATRFGWERPAWFADEGQPRVEIPDYDNPNWTNAVRKEHLCVRTNVGLIDQSSFSKFEVFGRDSLALLDRACTASIDRPVGQAVYTLACNEKGGVEADITITRLDSSRFYLIGGSADGPHIINLLHKWRKPGEEVYIEDVTSGRSVLTVCGPNSRELLQSVSESSFDNESFPFHTSQSVWLGAAQVRAIRIGFVGELGWELHIPTEFGGYLYELLWEAGRKFNVQNVGYRAIDSLRLEKGFRVLGKDLGNWINPYEAGLAFTVDLKKPEFIGKACLEKARVDGRKYQTVIFSVDSTCHLFGNERIFRGGEYVGQAMSAGPGYAVDRSIAYGFLPAHFTPEGDYSMEVFGELRKAQWHTAPLYDPRGVRMRS